MTTATTQALAGIFSGMGNARKLMDSEYTRPGHYWCRIDACKVGKNRKQIDFAAVEMTVIHVIDDLNGTGHRKGEAVTFYIDKRSDYFASEIRAFVANVMGMPFDDVQVEHAVQVFGDDQPLRGTTVEFIARNVITQKNTDFTKVSFKREVPATELLTALPVEDQALYYPGNILNKLAELEKQSSAA